MEDTVKITDMYMKILSPLSDEIKLDLISKLSASLLRKRSRVKSLDTNLFSGLSGAWEDDLTPEEETELIKGSFRSGSTRIIKEW
ncbi:hypothetical protein DW083_19995 [Parabacteroides sp. AF48-14]|uniref:hypothetical protein n=1 Tax=Parabacteroides sp. AF48-14 TaxID=2292052 RepID=UPI000F00266A|nr:hypothetical protein [Parabacteroides sp. AF48-14]RHO65854.1 hypothetical protein DW083_19995 [Parabacteroides sp. AF48-14]